MLRDDTGSDPRARLVRAVGEVTALRVSLAGAITDGDLRRHLAGDLLARTVDEVMTRDPKTVRRDTLAAKALEILNALNITTLMVVEGGEPVGIIHLHDLLRIGVA